MVNRKLLFYVQACEWNYGSLEKAPYLCDELKETRKIYPNIHQRDLTHKNIRLIKRDYENNFAIEEIGTHYHVRKDNMRFFADIYNWKRPKSYCKKHYKNQEVK